MPTERLYPEQADNLWKETERLEYSEGDQHRYHSDEGSQQRQPQQITPRLILVQIKYDERSG